MQHSLENFLFSCSVSGYIGPDLHDWSVKKDCSQRRLLRTLPRHPAKLHESHSCCQHQLRGLRVHEDWPRNFQMMLRVREYKVLRNTWHQIHRAWLPPASTGDQWGENCVPLLVVCQEEKLLPVVMSMLLVWIYTLPQPSLIWSENWTLQERKYNLNKLTSSHYHLKPREMVAGWDIML